MKIGIDIDDVVADFTNPFLEFYKTLTGKTILFDDVFSQKFEEVVGVTRQEAINFVRGFYKSEMFDYLLPINGSSSALQYLSEKYDIIFITSRHNEAKQKTPVWLAKHFPFINGNTIYSGDHQHGDNIGLNKAEICLAEGIPILIEDHKDYSLSCAEKGIKVILFDKPWNRDFEHDNITRVAGWNEALDVLNGGKNAN